MWAIRLPCQKDIDDKWSSRGHLHKTIHGVRNINKRDGTLIMINSGTEWYLSKFCLFNTKEEAEAVFSKIQEVQKCTQ